MVLLNGTQSQVYLHTCSIILFNGSGEFHFQKWNVESNLGWDGIDGRECKFRVNVELWHLV